MTLTPPAPGSLVTPGGHGLGHIPDAPDERDYLMPEATAPVPHQFVDLTKTAFMPPIWDQLQLGSCTAHGTVAAVLYAAMRGDALHTGDPMLARLACYWLARKMEGTEGQDSGAMIRDAIKAAAAGLPPESDWPYDISTYATPPADTWQADSTHRALTYTSVDATRPAIQTVLSAGLPVVFGVPLWASFENSEAIDTGVIPHPQPGEQLLGSHCMDIVGIGFGREWKADGQFPTAIDAVRYVKVRNSWGTGVYADGYLLMGVPYVRKHASDLWMVQAAD